jgi:DNA-binding transcriptional ArsR family regulator
MVYQSPALDRTFAALSDATRRAIIARLGEGEAGTADLARPFDMSLPAVMKHLDVLAEAGLVKREKQGRVVKCKLERAPLVAAGAWLDRHRAFWEGSLDKLEARASSKAAARKTKGAVR